MDAQVNKRYEEPVYLELHELIVLSGMVAGQLLALQPTNEVNHVAMLRALELKLARKLLILHQKLMTNNELGGTNGK